MAAGIIAAAQMASHAEFTSILAMSEIMHVPKRQPRFSR
jgi:hypothetical protein